VTNKDCALLWVLVVLIAVGSQGCGRRDIARADINYCLPSPKRVMRMNRVVFITLENRKGTPQIAEGMTEALAGAIQGRKLFHIDVVPATASACEDLPLSQREPYSMKELNNMRSALKCDAVLLGSVSQFHTYPRMQIGIYLRLLDLKNGTLAWGVDHIWDTTDKQTEDRIRRFFDSRMRSGYAPAQWRLGLISPKVFQKFIAYEVARTLPARPSRVRPAS